MLKHKKFKFWCMDNNNWVINPHYAGLSTCITLRYQPALRWVINLHYAVSNDNRPVYRQSQFSNKSYSFFSNSEIIQSLI